MISLFRLRSLLLCGLFTCLLSSFFYAQNSPAPTRNREPISVAVLERRYQESEETLRVVYDDLIKLVDAFPAPEFKEQLEASQVSWAKYRGEHAKILADAAESADGDWTVTLLEEVIRLNTNRTMEIRVIFAIMEHNFKQRFPGRDLSVPSRTVIP